MRIFKALLIVCAGSLLLSAATGCGGGGLASVTGTVKFPDGTPLTQGEIVFFSKDVNPKGQVRENGTFTLYTGEKQGAPPGSYSIYFANVDMSQQYVPQEQAVAAPGGPEGATMAPTGGLLIDPKFLAADTSGIKLDVKPGKNNFDIVVEKPGAGAAPAGPQ